MKAVICTKYGSPDVLELVEVQKPAPGPAEVLVRVHASAVTAADTMMRSGTPVFARLFLGLKRPKNPLMGTGFAGVVEAVGSDVTDFRAGDRVLARPAWVSAPTRTMCLYLSRALSLGCLMR